MVFHEFSRLNCRIAYVDICELPVMSVSSVYLKSAAVLHTTDVH